MTYSIDMKQNGTDNNQINHLQEIDKMTEEDDLSKM